MLSKFSKPSRFLCLPVLFLFCVPAVARSLLLLLMRPGGAAAAFRSFSTTTATSSFLFRRHPNFNRRAFRSSSSVGGRFVSNMVAASSSPLASASPSPKVVSADSDSLGKSSASSSSSSSSEAPALKATAMSAALSKSQEQSPAQEEEMTMTAAAAAAVDGAVKRARVVTARDDPRWELCGERLRSGHLVAFPTETVYGLGCHALDELAIAKVFEAKERPLTDPLIVHVLAKEEAFDLWRASQPSASAPSPTTTTDAEASSLLEGRILEALCDRFWPGPLTLVAKADGGKVPGCVMANTGYVACRSPSHATARAVIGAARVPLAAPSANKFGHVSPTTHSHVHDDLSLEDVWIVNDDKAEEAGAGGGSDGRSSELSSACQVGVESTVAKLEVLNDDGTSARVVVLRQGAISEGQLRDCLDGAGLLQQPRDGGAGAAVEVTSLQRATSDRVAHVAPGQTIRHYSPHVPSFLVSRRCYHDTEAERDDDVEKLRDAVVIDFGRQLSRWEGRSAAYRDLSRDSDAADAARRIFDTLRWAEQVPGARRILFPQLIVNAAANRSKTQQEQQRMQDDGASDEGAGSGGLALAVQDRLTRAASGVVVDSLAET